MHCTGDATSTSVREPRIRSCPVYIAGLQSSQRPISARAESAGRDAAGSSYSSGMTTRKDKLTSLELVPDRGSSERGRPEHRRRRQRHRLCGQRRFEPRSHRGVRSCELATGPGGVAKADRISRQRSQPRPDRGANLRSCELATGPDATQKDDLLKFSAKPGSASLPMVPSTNETCSRSRQPALVVSASTNASCGSVARTCVTPHPDPGRLPHIVPG